MAKRSETPHGAGGRDANGLSVERAEAEAARQALSRAGLLAGDLSPRHTGEHVVFPLREDAVDPDRLTRILDAFPGARLQAEEFRRRPARNDDYRTRLHDLPAGLRDDLPRAHDVVGDVAIMKLPESLQRHRREIAEALLATHMRLRTVALDHGVTGADRVRELEVVAGERRLTTTHREHGLRLEVALDRVYFSPRLATERARLLERIRTDERVLDLFAGIGAFVCLLARERPGVTITAIDQNPHAVRLLRQNLRHNRLPEDCVTLIEGDARVKAPRTRDWDHVVMNLPHDAHRFLDVAAECVAPRGEIHLYAILERADEDDYVQTALALLGQKTGAHWQRVERRHVRQYAPTMDGLAFTLRADTAP